MRPPRRHLLSPRVQDPREPQGRGRPWPSASRAGCEQAQRRRASISSKRASERAPHSTACRPRFSWALKCRTTQASSLQGGGGGAEPGRNLGPKNETKRGPACATEATRNGPRPRGRSDRDPRAVYSALGNFKYHRRRPVSERL